MPKKKEVVEEKVEEKKACKPKVNRLDLDFGREDLNLMRDKINELIDSNCK